jgi:hypothetical protein
MAIAWLTVLKSVPWTEVIGHAPKVADGAKKLWSAVARKGAAGAAAGAAAGDTVLSPEPPSMAEVAARLASAEGALAELHQQMLESTALIQDLAQQNGLLIARIETQRVCMRWLAAATTAACGLAIWAVALTLGH